MKKLLIITVIFLSVVSLAQAQRGSGQRPSKAGDKHQRMDPAQRIERQVQGLTKALELNTEQQAKVKEIFKKYGEMQREAFTKMRESAGENVDRDAMRTKMRTLMGDIRKKQDEEIKALLTDTQKEKYEQFQKERLERFKNGQGRQGGGGHGNRDQ